MKDKYELKKQRFHKNLIIFLLSILILAVILMLINLIWIQNINKAIYNFLNIFICVLAIINSIILLVFCFFTFENES